MKKIIFFIVLIAIGGMFLPNFSQAAVIIEKLKDLEVYDDFSIGPTRFEFFLDPGDEINQVLLITNRLGKPMDFEVGVEDFIGHPEAVTQFLGEEKSSFSSKEWFAPEVWEFRLEHGERIHLNVNIKVPENVEAGDHYAAVFVKTKPAREEKRAIMLSSRVGALFFLNISGEQIYKGELSKFEAEKKYYEYGPINFRLVFDNQGSIHLNPVGQIEIKNLLGKAIAQISIKDWWILRGVSRSKEASFDRKWLFGRYTASLELDRGYDGIVDTKTLTFWVLSWKVILAGLIGLFLVILFFRWIASHFEIRKKTPTVPQNLVH